MCFGKTIKTYKVTELVKTKSNDKDDEKIFEQQIVGFMGLSLSKRVSTGLSGSKRISAGLRGSQCISAEGGSQQMFSLSHNTGHREDGTECAKDNILLPYTVILNVKAIKFW